MAWSEDAWRHVESIYSDILRLPFLVELSSGELSEARFRFYIEQDIIYLARLAKSMSTLAARLTDVECREMFELFARETMAMEGAMQSDYFGDVTFAEDHPTTKACGEYMAFESHNAQFEDQGVALATLLPCFWIYKRVGDYVVNHSELTSNPYKEWIDLYSDPYFAREVEMFIGVCDRYAESSSEEVRERMYGAFVRSAQFEYDFWRDSYNMKYNEV